MLLSVYTSNENNTNRTVHRPILVEHQFFWTALFCLLLFDLCGLARNFSRVLRILERRKATDCHVRPDAIEQVCGAINYACLWYPKTVLCLQRSAVTAYMLLGLGVPARVVMGAQVVPFKAHAWTEVDNEPVNERKNVRATYRVWN